MTTVVQAASRIKQADPYADFTAQVREQNANEMWSRLGRDALNVGKAGLGFGLAVPSGYYLLSRLRQMMQKPRERPDDQITVPVKQGNADSGGIKGIFNAAVADASDFASNIFSGETLHDQSSLPAYWPAIGLAGVGGVALGGTAANKLNQYLRKKMVDTEVNQAKREYEEALAGQTKQAKQLHEDLDAIYDAYSEKKASLEDLTGEGLGVGLAALLGLGGIGAYYGKQFGDKNQNRRLIEQAQKLRRRRQYLKQPMPIYAVSEEVEGEPEEPTPDKAAPSLY
jgi:hypothetical protein